ncbi:rhombosortase [Parashewanella hymeniacidonis]|uniref:rhombosortase n=1 Tax=Parashewanella hymeniacidonis TaxID=2807618 RepID=UPI0030842214
MQNWINKYFGKTFSLGVGITLISSLLFLLNDYTSAVDHYLAYDRELITSGMYWQLITGNLLHSNIWHLLLNLAGLWVILSIHAMHYTRKQIWLLFWLFCLLEGIGLYLFSPKLVAYVGLSGMLHALFTFGAICDIRFKFKSGWLLLAGVVAKVTHEQLYGASAEVTQMIGTRVATESHLTGVIIGVIIALLFVCLQHGRKRLKH